MLFSVLKVTVDFVSNAANFALFKHGRFSISIFTRPWSCLNYKGFPKAEKSKYAYGLQEPFWTTLVVCVLIHAWGSIQLCWTGSFRAPKRSWIQMDAFGSLSSVVTLLALVQLWFVAGWSFSLSWYCMFSQWISLDTYLHVYICFPSLQNGRTIQLPLCWWRIHPAEKTAGRI